MQGSQSLQFAGNYLRTRHSFHEHFSDVELVVRAKLPFSVYAEIINIVT
jgi:hypothetical protein